MKDKLLDIYSTPWKRLVLEGSVFSLFFFFVFSTFQFGNPYVENVETVTNYDNYYSNYEIAFSIESDEPLKNVNISAMRYKNDEIYKIEETNDIYYREKDKVYLQEEDEESISSFAIPLEKLTQENIKKYIKKGDEIYKTEFKNGITQTAYEIKIKDFSSLYQDEIDEEGIVTIVIEEENKKIKSVQLDLNSFYYTTIKIEYKDYGKVTEDDLYDELNL